MMLRLSKWLAIVAAIAITLVVMTVYAVHVGIKIGQSKSVKTKVIIKVLKNDSELVIRVGDRVYTFRLLKVINNSRTRIYMVTFNLYNDCIFKESRVTLYKCDKKKGICYPVWSGPGGQLPEVLRKLTGKS